MMLSLIALMFSVFALVLSDLTWRRLNASLEVMERHWDRVAVINRADWMIAETVKT